MITDTPDETLYPVHKTKEDYAQNTVRKIELIFDKNEYAEIIELLRFVRQREDVKTNTQAVIHLLRSYAHSRH